MSIADKEAMTAASVVDTGGNDDGIYTMAVVALAAVLKLDLRCGG